MGLFGRRKASKATVPEWASFFASVEQVERFVAALRADMDPRGMAYVIHDGWIFLGDPAKDDTPRLGLTNIGQRCAQAAEREWAGFIREHVDKTLAALNDSQESLPGSFAEAAAKLIVRLFDEGEAGTFEGSFVTRRDLPGVITVLALDGTRTVRMVPADTLKEWGVDEDTAFGRAVNNLPLLAPVESEEVSAEHAPGVVVISGESMYVAGYMLEPDEVLPADAGLGVMFSAPTRHTMLAYPIRKETFGEGLRAMIFFTSRSFQDGPGSVSGRVFWRYRGETIDLPYEVTPQGVQFRPPQAFNDVMSKGLTE